MKPDSTRWNAAYGIILFAGLCGACAPNPYSSGSADTITGSVTYREDVALPSTALIEIKLLDPSVDETEGETEGYVAATTIRPEGRKVPIAFELAYDPKKILTGNDYVVRATIHHGDELLFTTNTINRVITGGNPKRADLVLVKVGNVEEEGDVEGGLVGTSWKLQDLQGERVLDQVEATLSFPEIGMVGGNATCNRFFGTVQVVGQTMKFGPIGSTKMACVDSVMVQETRYLQALRDVERFTIVEPEKILVLESAGTNPPLRFTRVSAE